MGSEHMGSAVIGGSFPACVHANTVAPHRMQVALAAVQEQEPRKTGRRSKGRIRELQEAREELAEKQLILLEKERELLKDEQTVMVLQQELEIERKLRALLTKEKEKAEEQAALAMGLCTGGAMLP